MTRVLSGAALVAVAVAVVWFGHPLLFLAVALQCWKIGVRHYCSTGS